MREATQALKRALTKLRFALPSRLPTMPLQYEAFVKSIIEVYQLPNLPSYRQAIATHILHLETTTNWKSKRFFAKSIHKAMSNQVAYEAIQAIQAEAKAGELKAVPETTG